MKFKLLKDVLIFITILFNIMLFNIDLYADEIVSNINISKIKLNYNQFIEPQDPELSYGKVLKISNNSITVKSIRETEVIYNFDDKTIFIDSTNGLKSNIEDIKVGDKVYFYHTPMLSTSYPQEAYTYVVAINIPMDIPVIKYHIVENIENNSDGINISVAQSNLVLKASNDVDIVYFDTGERATVDDIQLGTRFFTWYQAGYDINGKKVDNEGVIKKIIIAPFKDDEINIFTSNNLINKKGIIRDGSVFIPLREISNSYNMTVDWNAESNTATIDDNKRKMSFNVEQNNYVSSSSVKDIIGMTSPLKLNVFPFIDDFGSMWIPAYSLEAMLNYKVSIEANGKNVLIAKK